MKELKYLLIHNKEDFVLRTSRNTVIYLLCKILNSLNKYESKLVNQKEIVHIYIAIKVPLLVVNLKMKKICYHYFFIYLSIILNNF